MASKRRSHARRFTKPGFKESDYAINMMTVNGFKGFQSEARIPLRPLTIVMGENNSGKSAILKSLASLVQTKIQKKAQGIVSDWISSGRWFDLGSDETYINDKNDSEEFSIGFESNNVSINYQFQVNEEDRFTCNLSKVRLKLGTEVFSINSLKSMPQFESLYLEDPFEWRRRRRRHPRATIENEYILLPSGVSENDLINANKSRIDLFHSINDDSSLDFEARLKLVTDFCDMWDIKVDLPKSENEASAIFESYISDPREFQQYVEPISLTKMIGMVGTISISATNPSSLQFNPVLLNFGLKHRYVPHILNLLISGQNDDMTEFDRYNRTRGYERYREFQKFEELIEESYSFFENLERLIDSEYLSAFRLEPKRVYDIRDQNQLYSRTMQIICTADDKSLKKINKALKDLVNIKIFPKSLHGKAKNHSAQFYEITVGQDKKNAHLHLCDVGYGISQLLPILSQLQNSKHALILEEAESNLHPRAQAKLMEIIVDHLNTDDLNPQIIMESHSEHFLLRIRQLISDGLFEDEHVSLVFVTQDKDGGTLVHHAETHKGEFLEPLPESFSFYDNGNPTGSSI